MVSLRVEVKKRDVAWVFLLLVVFATVVGYAYGTSSPSVMGHSLDEIAVPDYCVSGQVLGIVEGHWDCVDVSTEAALDLVYGIHSSEQCTNLGGVVKSAGDSKVCAFSGGECSPGWIRYFEWSTTASFNGVQHCLGYRWEASSCDYDCSPCDGRLVPYDCNNYWTSGCLPNYVPWTGPQSCTTGGHSWSNAAQESCSYCNSCCDLWSCVERATAYAIMVEVGCY